MGKGRGKLVDAAGVLLGAVFDQTVFAFVLTPFVHGVAFAEVVVEGDAITAGGLDTMQVGGDDLADTELEGEVGAEGFPRGVGR